MSDPQRTALIRERKKRALSVGKAAQRIGINHQTLRAAELGLTEPNGATQAAIAKFYGREIIDLFPFGAQQFTEHPTETARRALLAAADVESPPVAATMRRLAALLPDRRMVQHGA